MEIKEIDYEKLIDPLCIPLIKFLREEKGVNTLFCCQGCSKEDSRPYRHSIRGYISAEITPESEELLSKIYELESKRWKHKKDTSRNPKFESSKERKRVTFWMASRVWKSSEELKEEWDIILKHLKENG